MSEMQQGQLRTLTVLSAVFLIAGLATIFGGFAATKGARLLDGVVDKDSQLLAKATAGDFDAERVNFSMHFEGAVQMHTGIRQIFSALSRILFILGALVSGAAIIQFARIRTMRKAP